MNAVCAQSPSPAIGPVSDTWPPFAAALADAIGRLKEDQFLVIAVKHSLRAVQFAGQGALGLRAEVVANAFLDPADGYALLEVLARPMCASKEDSRRFARQYRVLRVHTAIVVTSCLAGRPPRPPQPRRTR